MNWLPLFLLLVVSGNGDTWPAFLGAGAQTSRLESLPLNWSPTENIAWFAEVPGHGQSSPIVWKDRAYVTSVEGPNKESYHTVCLRLADGVELWRRDLANSLPVKNSYYVSRAAPTPVADEDGVIALFESGDCVAYSHDGDVRWNRPLGKEEGPLVAEFGLGASPCQTAAAVFVLLEHDGPSCLLALDKATGKTLWKAERTPRRSWSSPVVMDIDGKAQVVVSSAGSVDGYDAETGKLLWTFDDVGGNTGTSPIPVGEGTFLIGASPGRSGENRASSVDSNALLKVTRAGDRWNVERKWVAEGASPSWASPISHEGVAYWINRAGVVLAFDAASGEPLYTERTKESCWATPIVAGDRVYLLGKDGVVTVLAAGPEFKVLAENTTWTRESLPPEPLLIEEETEERRRGAPLFAQRTLYGAAVCEGALLLRTGNCLVCIRESE